MSETPAPIATPEKSLIIQANTESIFKHRADFPGTAAVADMLMPYYQAALKTTQVATAATAVDRLRNGNGKEPLPEALAREVRQNLTALQSSAFHMESVGDVKRAATIREVATSLSSMLRVVHELQHDVGHTAGKTA